MKYFPGFLALYLLIFALVAIFVPDDSIFKIIFGYVTGVVLAAMIVYFTGLYGFFRKLFKKKCDNCQADKCCKK
jgi:hypothetical protein